MANMVTGGKTPILSSHELRPAGLYGKFLPIGWAVCSDFSDASSILRIVLQSTDCRIDRTHVDNIGFDEFNQLMGKEAFDEFEKQF